MRDETFDYGLEPGESFEPIDDAADWFDLSQPHILTALGPIDPDDLGYTACLYPSGDGDDRWSRNPGGSVAALEDAFNGGLRGLVITEPLRTEQDVADLIWIAGRSPIHLIVARDPTKKDIFAGTSLAPGCLSVDMTPPVPKVEDAISGDLEQLPLVLTFAPNPGIIVVPPSLARAAHLGRLIEPDFTWEFAAAMIDRGAFNVVRMNPDQFLRDADDTLVQPDFADLLLLALGPSPSSWMEAVERSPLELMERRFDAPTVRRILVDNPARALTIRR